MDVQDFFRLATGQIEGPIVAGRVSPHIQSVLSAQTRVVLISEYSVRKQLSRHGTVRDGVSPLSTYYDYVGDAIAGGDAFRFSGNRVGLVLGLQDIRHHRLQAVIKATADKSELYLISFYPLRKNDWNRVCRRNNPIPKNP